MKVKFLTLYIVFIFISLGFTTADQVFNSQVSNSDVTKINWLTIGEAFELNKKNPKKTFIDFYTGWCGWCKKMDNTTFVDNKVVHYVNKHYYAVKLDAESSESILLDKSYTTPRAIAHSMQVNSFPTIVFIEDDFKTITVQLGYKSARSFLKTLQTFNTKK